MRTTAVLVVVPLLAVLSTMSVGCAPRAGVLRADHPTLRSADGQDGLGVARARAVWSDPRLDDDDDTTKLRLAVAAAAGAAVGGGAIVVAGERFRLDCSGVARGIYSKAGVPLGHVHVDGRQNDTHVLFELVRQSGGSLRRSDPLPGDLAFFDDTWDEDGDGVLDDPLSHVAVVEKVEDDGTVVLVHRVGNAIVRARMNLAQPHDRYDAAGRPINHYLRSAQGGEPARTTAELFVAFGSMPLTRGGVRLARN